MSSHSRPNYTDVGFAEFADIDRFSFAPIIGVRTWSAFRRVANPNDYQPYDKNYPISF